MTVIVVGNMVGPGIFMLPTMLAQMASPLGAALAWLQTGFGVLMIALVFNALSVSQPDLTGGPADYLSAFFPMMRSEHIFSAGSIKIGADF